MPVPIVDKKMSRPRLQAVDPPVKVGASPSRNKGEKGGLTRGKILFFGKSTAYSQNGSSRWGMGRTCAPKKSHLLCDFEGLKLSCNGKAEYTPHSKIKGAEGGG